MPDRAATPSSQNRFHESSGASQQSPFNQRIVMTIDTTAHATTQKRDPKRITNRTRAIEGIYFEH